MEMSKSAKGWERTNVSNLLKNRKWGTYYARLRINGKQKWRSLDTTVFSVAKLKLGDAEKDMRAMALAGQANGGDDRDGETTMDRFLAIYRERTTLDPSLAPNSKLRREIAIKAILKTWPDLPTRDVRRISAQMCQAWAAKAVRNGTGFVAPNTRTVRAGMSHSAFNKCVDTLRAIFDIARELGVIYQNPAATISKATIKPKRLELPSSAQFHAIVQSVATAGARWSKDCADMVRFLAYSGTRLREATALRWQHVDLTNNRLTIPGTKSATSYRVVPVFPPLAALIAEMRDRRGDEPEDAPIIRVHECLGALDSACQAVGVKPLTHHDLRHLFATRCIESGVDIPTVSRWLGHSDGGALAMKTYGHLRHEHSAAQAAKVRF